MDIIYCDTANNPRVVNDSDTFYRNNFKNKLEKYLTSDAGGAAHSDFGFLAPDEIEYQKMLMKSIHDSSESGGKKMLTQSDIKKLKSIFSLYWWKFSFYV